MSRLQRLEHLPSVGSTNIELRERAAQEPQQWPHLSALLADEQTAGRGRLGRAWLTPPGQAMTASVLLRPRVEPDHLGWLTLLTGLAVSRAIAALPAADAPASTDAGPDADVDTDAGAALTVGTKWPNDVLLGGAPVPGWGAARKVAGVLTELLPAPAPTATAPTATPPTGSLAPTGSPARSRDELPAVIVGIGINLQQGQAELPVPWATSLRSAGLCAPAASDMLHAVAGELAELLEEWETAGGRQPPAGLATAVRGACWSLGRQVRIDLPGGQQLHGRAADLTGKGHLVVIADDGRRHVVLAGDVQHVRDAGTVGKITSSP